MSFRIHPLPRDRFAHLFGLDAAALARFGVHRVTADAAPGYPCRVSLADAAVGETLLLLNHAHLDIDTPYASRHAIYVREGAEEAHPAPGEVPAALASRLLSVRGFDSAGFMRTADVAEGAGLGTALGAAFADPSVAFADIHNAGPGCFAARATRA